MDLQTALIMFCCFSVARLLDSVTTVSPRCTFCISSRLGRLSSDVPQKLCMGKFDKHLPRLEVSQFSRELVLLTLPMFLISSAWPVETTTPSQRMLVFITQISSPGNDKSSDTTAKNCSLLSAHSMKRENLLCTGS